VGAHAAVHANAGLLVVRNGWLGKNTFARASHIRTGLLLRVAGLKRARFLLKSGDFTNLRMRATFILLLAVCLAGTMPAAQIADVTLSVTLTNPNPVVAGGQFGRSVAAFGTDRLVVGIDSSGSRQAYLFSTNGSHLATITNPVPPSTFSSVSVAALGTHAIVLGIQGTNVQTGAAYLVTTNSVRIMTFTNPGPDYFGYPVSAIGSDKVAIGGLISDKVHLFATNGRLIVTLTNPAPGIGNFGRDLAPVGNDKLLIGSEAEKAYLFHTNGTLMRTFLSPTYTQWEEFGDALCGLGPDRVIIGAPLDTVGSTRSGAAYLYGTNGSLLTVFTNPVPVAFGHFGESVAAVGMDKVLVGCSGAMDGRGAAYLFDTNGVLLTTTVNPSTGTFGSFGELVAAAGSGGFVIPDTIRNDVTGVACLYNVASFDVPMLSAERGAGDTVRISWPLPGSGFVLQHAPLPGSANSAWSQVPFPYSTNASEISVTVTPAVSNRAYRLRR
jgi:hypothetical protein